MTFRSKFHTVSISARTARVSSSQRERTRNFRPSTSSARRITRSWKRRSRTSHSSSTGMTALNGKPRTSGPTSTTSPNCTTSPSSSPATTSSIVPPHRCRSVPEEEARAARGPLFRLMYRPGTNAPVRYLKICSRTRPGSSARTHETTAPW